MAIVNVRAEAGYHASYASLTTKNAVLMDCPWLSWSLLRAAFKWCASSAFLEINGFLASVYRVHYTISMLVTQPFLPWTRETSNVWVKWVKWVKWFIVSGWDDTLAVASQCLRNGRRPTHCFLVTIFVHFLLGHMKSDFTIFSKLQFASIELIWWTC